MHVLSCLVKTRLAKASTLWALEFQEGHDMQHLLVGLPQTKRQGPTGFMVCPVSWLWAPLTLGSPSLVSGAHRLRAAALAGATTQEFLGHNDHRDCRHRSTTPVVFG